MTIESIQNGFGEAATKVFEPIKGAAVWTGRQISKGFTKSVESLKAVWDTAFPVLKNFATRIANFLRTAPGLGLTLAATSIGFGYSAYTTRDNSPVFSVLLASALVTAAAAGGFFGYGLAAGFNTALI